jgi:hypothetical protein
MHPHILLPTTNIIHPRIAQSSPPTNYLANAPPLSSSNTTSTTAKDDYNKRWLGPVAGVVGGMSFAMLIVIILLLVYTKKEDNAKKTYTKNAPIAELAGQQLPRYELSGVQSERFELDTVRNREELDHNPLCELPAFVPMYELWTSAK